MSDDVSIKQIFQNMIPQQLGLLSARVTLTNPLTVVATNNQKLKISSQSLVVPLEMTKHSKKMSFSIDNKTYSNINVTVDNSLKNGDIVYLLQIVKSGKFLIVGRGD